MLPLLVVGLLTLTGTGCRSQEGSSGSSTGPAGSISDINRKMGGSSKPAAKPSGGAASQSQVVLLVLHDAEGKPLYAEVQRSCGDPAADRRAVDFVLSQRRFPKGAANTITVTVDPKRLPKP